MTEQSQPIDPLVAFGTRLRALRVERGLSQEDLAGRSGLDRTYISSCERGKRNPTIRVITKLATALGVEPFELLRGGHGDQR